MRVGNFAKLPVNVSNEALFITFTKGAGNFAKLLVILQNYQFITFTLTYASLMRNSLFIDNGGTRHKHFL